MYSLRLLVVSTILALPFFAIAQTSTTTSTSTAVRPPDMMQARADAQAKIDAMVQDYLNTIPSPNEVNQRTLVDDINIKTDPQYPGPNEMVIATLVGNIVDLNKATISWYSNGKAAGSGVGQNMLTFQNGQSGKTTTITVRVVAENGTQIQKNFSFTPVGVTILWEADTYVPPFYKGKPLLSPEARVRTVAIPDIGTANNSLSAGNLVYAWEKSGMPQISASGYNKNSFSFVAPLPFNKAEVGVKVSSLTNSMQSKEKISLPLSSPFILLYEKHPLLGVWYNRPFGTDITLNMKEFSISAEPYFFSNERSDTPTLKYDWLVNGSVTQNFGRNITLRNDTGAKGDSLVSLGMRGLKQTYQSASQNLNIHFTESFATGRPTF